MKKIEPKLMFMYNLILITLLSVVSVGPQNTDVPIVSVHYGGATLFKGIVDINSKKKIVLDLNVDTTRIEELRFKILYKTVQNVKSTFDMEINNSGMIGGESDTTGINNIIHFPVEEIWGFVTMTGETGDIKATFVYSDNKYFIHPTPLFTLSVKLGK